MRPSLAGASAGHPYQPPHTELWGWLHLRPLALSLPHTQYAAPGLTAWESGLRKQEGAAPEARALPKGYVKGPREGGRGDMSVSGAARANRCSGQKAWIDQKQQHHGILAKPALSLFCLTSSHHSCLLIPPWHPVTRAGQRRIALHTNSSSDKHSTRHALSTVKKQYRGAIKNLCLRPPMISNQLPFSFMLCLHSMSRLAVALHG